MPSTEFRWASLAEAVDAGLPAMVKRHWDEVGVHKEDVPVDVDWAGYADLEDRGILRLMTAWRGDVLVGYASFLVMPHLHYKSTLHALNDAVFVEPGHRGVGVQMIAKAEEALALVAAPGCVRITYHVKHHVEADRGTFATVFARRGYQPFETVYDKVVRL